MAFLNIVPYNKQYMDWNVDPIPLRVVRGDVDMSPDVNVKVTSLNNGYKHFQNNSGQGDSFRVKVIVNKDDTVQGEKDVKNPDEIWYFFGEAWRFDMGSTHYSTKISVNEALDYWIKEGVYFFVTSDNRRAVDIPDGLYLVTGNQSRKQSYDAGFSVWDLEFTRYVQATFGKFNNDNAMVTKAKKTYSNNKKSSSKTTKKTTSKKDKAKQSSSLNSKLGKCSLNNLKYSKTKKVTDCVKTLQKYLNKKLGCNLAVDGWYGDATKKQVKKFQTNYKKKYKLNPTGNMDKATLNAMTKV